VGWPKAWPRAIRQVWPSGTIAQVWAVGDDVRRRRWLRGQARLAGGGNARTRVNNNNGRARLATAGGGTMQAQAVVERVLESRQRAEKGAVAVRSAADLRSEIIFLADRNRRRRRRTWSGSDARALGRHLSGGGVLWWSVRCSVHGPPILCRGQCLRESSVRTWASSTPTPCKKVGRMATQKENKNIYSQMPEMVGPAGGTPLGSRPPDIVSCREADEGCRGATSGGN
jgi:hypothetical protein